MNEEEKYQAAIPSCCKFQTAKEHLDILFFCAGVKANLACEKYCQNCEFYIKRK